MCLCDKDDFVLYSEIGVMMVMPMVPIFVSSFLGLELTRTENVETKRDLCGVVAI